MRHLINLIFRLERLNGGERCPDYMHRWTLLKTRWFSCYLHHFLRDDWSTDYHDHPKRFVSVGLRGRYVEHTPMYFHGLPETNVDCTQVFRAPWARSFPARHIHRITLYPGETCWTLVFVGKPVRDWGFWTRRFGQWLPWREYVDGPAGEAGKNCD